MRLNSILEVGAPDSVRALSCEANSIGMDVSAEFLGSCASIPYRSSQPGTAQAWVSKTVGGLQPGKTLKDHTRIGTVTFTLSGSPDSGTARLRLSTGR
jgi:hypothetical protein